MPDFGVSKQILYLTYDGLSDPLGRSQILPYLCVLSKKGYTISIISFEKPDRFKTNSVEIQSICLQYKLIWKPLLYHKSPPILSTLFDLYHLKRLATKLHREKPFSIIHCRSYLTSIIGLWMKKQFGSKFIFDMRGFWADERVDGGLWNLDNPLYAIVYKFFKKKEKDFIKKADHIISLTNNAKQEILTWGLSNNNITVIPCCVDLNLFDPEKINQEEKEKLKAELGIHADDFVLLYLGSWGTWYMTQEMLNFFSALKKQISKIKFLIITSDTIDLKDYSLVSDVIIRNVPRSKVPLFISIADHSIFFIKPAYSKKASSATKMAEIMAMNVPIITNSGWGDAEQIINSSSGLLYEVGITEFKVGLARPLSINTREYCYRNLSLEYGVEKFNSVYLELLK